MTLILDLDLDIVKLYMCTKNEVCSSRQSQSPNMTHRHTFCCCDLDSMTLICELNLDILKVYLSTNK